MGDYSFVSSSGSECLLWEIPSEALSANKDNSLTEVVQPAKILDVESSNAI